MQLKLTLLLTAACSLQALCANAKELLISPPGQPPLPTAQEASTSAAASGLNLTNIQGDILIGMKKNKELFFFFSIVDVPSFKAQLKSGIAPLITSTFQLLPNTTDPADLFVNIAFSSSGLSKLGIANPDLGDNNLFQKGQFNGATNLGDLTSNWLPQFAGTSIHGVFLIASDTLDGVSATLSQVQSILGSSISESYRLQGQARPGDQQGHEHFGFMDGISNPAVNGFNTPHPGQALVNPGVILFGESGDPKSRPGSTGWAKDGSFLVFRQLAQRVPEFNKFLLDHAPSEANMTLEENAELLGARMIGRWKSGAPVAMSPLFDNLVVATNAQQNNNFDFSAPSDSSLCPVSSHIRKTNPRADFSKGNFPNHIIRAGIPYGPEVTDAENASNSSSTDPSLDRGLAFVAYQSDIDTGFETLQSDWANDPSFRRGGVGADPIIGPNGVSRSPAGLDPSNLSGSITIMEDFVVSKGGEYFFSPPISAIQTTLSS